MIIMKCCYDWLLGVYLYWEFQIMAGSLVAMELRTIPVANKNGVSSLKKPFLHPNNVIILIILLLICIPSTPGKKGCSSSALYVGGDTSVDSLLAAWLTSTACNTWCSRLLDEHGSCS